LRRIPILRNPEIPKERQIHGIWKLQFSELITPIIPSNHEFFGTYPMRNCQLLNGMLVYSISSQGQKWHFFQFHRTFSYSVVQMGWKRRY